MSISIIIPIIADLFANLALFWLFLLLDDLTNILFSKLQNLNLKIENEKDDLVEKINLGIVKVANKNREELAIREIHKEKATKVR